MEFSTRNWQPQQLAYVNKYAKDDTEDDLEENRFRLHPGPHTFRHKTSSKQCENVTPKIRDPQRNHRAKKTQFGEYFIYPGIGPR